MRLLFSQQQNCVSKQKHTCFCFIMANKHKANSIDSAVLTRIYGRGGGGVFTPGDFRDLGSPVAVRLALMRHARAGVIRNLARGLYDYPRKDPQLWVLTPSIDTVANRTIHAMSEAMFFGEVPAFDEILRVVGEFEARFNRGT